MSAATSTSAGTSVGTDDVVLTERRGAVLLITLNRPERRNALNRAVAQRLADIFDDLDVDPTLAAAVLTGAGADFCAGMDLKAFSDGEYPEVEGRGLAGIGERPPGKPLIAAVEGHAVAGGFEVLLACDLVVASETARFGLPEVRRGLVAAGGGLVRLPSRIPFQQALRLLLTGDILDAAWATAAGLVCEVTPTGRAVEVALDMAGRIAANAPMAVQVSKQVAYASVDWPQSEALRRQEEHVRPVLNSVDAFEGAAAFVEKRNPIWSGR